MENNFVTSGCRFHTKEKNKLLIIGYFEKNAMEENVLSIQLDGKDIPFTVDESTRQMGNLLTASGRFVTKDFFVWVDLPSDWEKCKTLKMFNVENQEKKLVYKATVVKLIKESKKVFFNLDKSELTGQGFIVMGWYVNTDDRKICFKDADETVLPVDIVEKRRADVCRAFPEADSDAVIGFEALYKGAVPKKIYICFEGKNEQKRETIKFTNFSMKKVIVKLRQSLSKAKYFYKQYGAKATIIRCIDKVLGRDAISYQAWLKRHMPSKSVLQQQRAHKFVYQPKISIVIPLYKTPEKYLAELIASIKAQTYANWELCLSDGSGENSPMTEILKKYEAEDERIKVVYNGKALQISENTNAALRIASGDFIAFADHDDLMAPNALFECVSAINEDSTIEILYTDEDKVDMNGKGHFMPHFKPDFNLDMLRSVNYICHLFVVRRDVYEKVGMLNHEFDGAQDYDFVLRCVETSSNIKHIAKILYHWRAHKDSTAENPESKRYAFEAGARAIQAHYDRLGIRATVEATIHNGIYRSHYELQGEPLISIVIPNKDHISDLELCISSIEKKSSYKNYEFIVVENNSTDENTFEYYKELEKKCPRAKVVYWKGQGFNYPAINNYGVEQASGEYILFLNNDTEIVNEDCLKEMLSICMREDVGAVGARLYYEDGTIQHAGVIVGLGGIAGHAFVGFPHDSLGYFGRIQMTQNYSAVTAACVMIKKSIYNQVGGFDERYAVAFNDVDLCMKIREAGYLIVYNPYAELNHYESKSRGYEDTEEKVQRFNSEITLFKNRWNDFLESGDPCYSPNLTLDKNDFTLNVRANHIDKM